MSAKYYALSPYSNIRKEDIMGITSGEFNYKALPNQSKLKYFFQYLKIVDGQHLEYIIKHGKPITINADFICFPKGSYVPNKIYAYVLPPTFIDFEVTDGPVEANHEILYYKLK